VVEFVDAERIIVRVDEKENSLYELGTDLYPLTKFLRTNQNTCVNQRPIIRRGDRVEKGQILLMVHAQTGESWLWAGISCVLLCPGAATILKTPSLSVKN